MPVGSNTGTAEIRSVGDIRSQFLVMVDCSGRSEVPGPRISGRAAMDWVRILAYVTGKVDQELLGRNEYLATENRILSL